MYTKFCDLQGLSLSASRIGGGARLAASPKLIIGLYYYLHQPACTDQSSLFPNDYRIEKLGSNHAVGIELIQPLIQWNLSGYYKNKIYFEELF